MKDQYWPLIAIAALFIIAGWIAYCTTGFSAYAPWLMLVGVMIALGAAAVGYGSK